MVDRNHCLVYGSEILYHMVFSIGFFKGENGGCRMIGRTL